MEKVAEGIWKIRFGMPEKNTPVKLRQNSICKEALAQMEEGKKAFVSLDEKDIRFTNSARRITIRLPMDSSEDIFGFGLQLLSINYAGRRRYIKVNSDPRMDTGESHAPVPFYVSTAGYGLFVDTFRYVTFSMGTNSIKGASVHKKEVNQTHEEFSETALYALKRAEEERCIVIDVPSAEGVDIYLFAGSIMEAVQRYNLFSGGGCLPPMWGLGMWYRVYGGSDSSHLLKLAKNFRDEHMPMDVIGIEPGWHSHSYSCTYEWSDLFPDPNRMILEVKEQGYKLNLWEHAYVYPASDIYEEIYPYSGDYEVWNGIVPDFSTKQAREIFARLHKEKFVQKGIAGFKLDECDNSDFNPSNWSFPEASQFPSGMDGEQMHSAIGVLYQQMITGIYREQNIRTLSQVRSSGALAAALPFILYSDLYDHRDFIRGIVTSSFSGLLWAPEVRDCIDGKDLLRRMQTVCFSAHALINGWRIPNPPWKQTDIAKNLANEEMDGAQYYTDACRRLFELRMSLAPYLYSAFVEYLLKGVPPLRAVCMEYPDDLEARNLDDEYFFGKDLLVCPLTIEDGTSRKVYLPQGKWYGFFDGREYEGAGWIEVTADWEEIPVFARDGAVVPFAEAQEYIDTDTVFSMIVKVYGKKASEFILYEDDFVSWEYEKSGFKEIRIIKDCDGNILIHGAQDSEKYRFCGQN